MKTRLSVILDTAFISFIVFLLATVFFNTFFQQAFSITFASCVCALTAVFTFRKLSNKSQRLKLNRVQKQERDLAIAQLNLYTLQEQNKLFETLLNKLGYQTELKKSLLKIPNKKVAIFAKFGFDGITKTDVVKTFNSIDREYTAYILCEKVSDDVKEFADRFDGRIKIAYADQVYCSLSENELLPKTKFNFPQKKQNFHIALKSLFERKKAKTHFYIGSTFLLTSYFVPIKLYYVFFGCLFLILSLICFLYGKQNTKTVA